MLLLIFSPPPLNIVVFTHAGGSPRHGPNTRWYFLGSSLLKYGYKTHIVSCSSFHKYFHLPSFSSLFHEEVINGIVYHWVKSTPYRRRGFFQVLNQFIYTFLAIFYIPRLLFLKVSYVVASSPHPFVYFPAYILARLTNSKLIYEVRDLWPALLNQLNVITPYHPYSRLLSSTEYLAVKSSSVVVSVKQDEYIYFNTVYNLPLQRHHFIPNGFLPQPSLTSLSPPLSLADIVGSRSSCRIYWFSVFLL